MAYYREGSQTSDPDYDHLFQVVEEEVAGFQASHPRGPFWGLRVIWSTPRDQDPRSIIEDADDCLATKLAWPHLLAGYDLAGSESLGRPLADLLPELFWLRKQSALEGVTIPFFLRAADHGGGGDATTDGNLFDALLLGSRRIGNPLSLHNHPRLVEAIRSKRILVESDPSSAAGSSNLHHPLPALLAQGVSCALCDGDLGVLSGPGRDVGSRMTDVFWQTLQAWDSIDLATLGSLAENSVRWAAFEDQDAETWYVQSLLFTLLSIVCVLGEIPLPGDTARTPPLGEPGGKGGIGRWADKYCFSRARDLRAASVGAGVKAARLRQWAVDWERYCLWVVTEYGEAYGDRSDGSDRETDAAQ